MPRRPFTIFATAALAILAIGWVDYITGYEVSLSVFYAAPVIFAVWCHSRAAGACAALLSAATWFIADHATGHYYSTPAIPVWNAGVRCSYLLLTGFLASAARAQIVATQERAKSLERVLPVCSECKKIQDDDGAWMDLESYVMEHFSAHPKAKVCPDCSKRHYIQKVSPEGNSSLSR